MLIKKIFFTLILVGANLFINYGCYLGNYRSEYKTTDNFVSINEKIELIESISDLDTIFINQISVDMPYYAKEDYICFSDSFYHPGYRAGWMSSRKDICDIYVDFRLLNRFSFVFTQHNSESIIGLIRQTELIKQPRDSCWYYIYYEPIINLIGRGDYDIYGFFNDSLVFKSVYNTTNIPYDLPFPLWH